ncbi:MAG: hypothetical protein CMD02_03200 [Flavobacteriales bacterium]|nr:hypothetical protein [Flavobacteriales bacterium]
MNKSLLCNIKSLLLVLLALSISLSVFLTNIILLTLLITVIFEGGFNHKIKKILSSKWMVSIIILLLLYYIYSICFVTFTDTYWLLKRVSLLWLLPVFYSTNFSNKIIKKSVFTFFISMFVSSVIAISENYGILNINEENWTIAAYLKYTEHNVFLASTILILIYSYFKLNLQPKFKILLLIFLPFYLFSLFTEAGKSGQLVFVLLLLIFIFIHLRKNIKYLLIAIGLLFLGLFVVYNSSEMLQKRYKQEISRFLNKQSSSRSLLFTHSIELIKKKPIIGYGAGAFTDVFRKIDNETEKIVKYHQTPHNNYLYVWVELGIPGLIIFLSVFYFQIRELKKLKDGFVRILLPIMYLAIMFTDSYLFGMHNTLILYIFLSVIVVNYQYKPS